MTEEAVLEFADGTKIVEFIDGGCSADDALLDVGSTDGEKLGYIEAALVEFIDGGCSADDALLNEGSTNDELLGGDKLGSSEAALVEFTDGD